MIILPAIDIKDKACVRLIKGDYDTAHKVAEDPYKTAGDFALAGAKWIHMVDLKLCSGCLSGQSGNFYKNSRRIGNEGGTGRRNP